MTIYMWQLVLALGVSSILRFLQALRVAYRTEREKGNFNTSIECQASSAQAGLALRYTVFAATLWLLMYIF